MYKENMDTKIIRENLVNQLKGGQAHMTMMEAVKDFPESKMNIIFPNGTYTSWALLEHIRFSQHDILDFLINSQYREPEWPKDYWPNLKKTVTKKEWDNTLQDFYADLKKLEEMAINENIDLTAKVPNGDGQTYIKELLLIADHNAYHIGEFSIMRQTLNTWSR